MLGGSVGPIQIDLRLRVGTPVDLIEIDTASVVATIDRQPVGSDKPPKSHGHNGDGDTSSNLRARFHIEATGPDRFGKSTSASGRSATLALSRKPDIRPKPGSRTSEPPLGVVN